jgi:hypothetical protein
MTSYIFARDAVWTEFSPDALKSYPDCMLKQSNSMSCVLDSGFDVSLTGSFVINDGKMCRVDGDSTIYGPIYDATTDGIILPGIFSLPAHAQSIEYFYPTDNLPQMTACNVNFPAMDQLSPALMNYAVWTWDDGMDYR